MVQTSVHRPTTPIEHEPSFFAIKVENRFKEFNGFLRPAKLITGKEKKIFIFYVQKKKRTKSLDSTKKTIDNFSDKTSTLVPPLLESTT